MTTNLNIRPHDASADVVVSTCALRLSAKYAVFAEAFRALTPGGRFSITDVVLLRSKPAAPENKLDAFASRVASAAHVHHLRSILSDLGFVDVRIEVDVRKQDEQYFVLAELSATKP